MSNEQYPSNPDDLRDWLQGPHIEIPKSPEMPDFSPLIEDREKEERIAKHRHRTIVWLMVITIVLTIVSIIISLAR